MLHTPLPMGISLKTHKRLWTNAGNVCAFPGCEQRLLLPTEGEDDEVVVGKECHIVAQGGDGPRAPAGLTSAEAAEFRHLAEDRDGYANLILLCGVHHDVIDGDVTAYTVERLVRMKQEHERAVDEALSPQRRHIDQLEIRYAAIVDEWARRIDIDHWDGRMSRLVADGAIREDVLDEFPPLNDWLLRRVWPRSLPDLESALHNFRFVAQDLGAVVAWYETRQNGVVFVDRVYNERSFDQDTYQFLRQRSGYSRDLAADLTIELTRAVNLVADRVREHLWPSYRLAEGYATIGLGFNPDLTFETLRPLYPPDAPARPYPGLRKFVTERAERDYAVGEGAPPEGIGVPGLLAWGDTDEDED
jgi:hypothetical protein